MTVLTSQTVPSQTVPGQNPRQTDSLSPASGEQHFFLSNVEWQGYVAIGKALPDRGGLRLTYDRGNLEFMTTSFKHETLKKWLGRFVETIAEELNQDIVPGGNMTFEREDLAKALEGDDCYWILHEARMRGKEKWDPALDPPPDLFLEIEVSRSVLNRLGICASLRIPEVWSFNGEQLRVYRLQADGTYQVSDKSHFFPLIPIAEIVRFLNPPEGSGYLAAVQEFRGWLRRLLGKPPIT
jgi:hypothetical protein